MRCYLKVFEYLGIHYLQQERLFGAAVSGVLVFLGGIVIPLLLVVGGLGALATGILTDYQII
jgi:hypothetical protein